MYERGDDRAAWRSPVRRSLRLTCVGELLLTARIAEGTKVAPAPPVVAEGLRRAVPATPTRYASRTGPGQRVPVSVALSALGTVLVADRKPETKPRTGNSPVYQASTRSRRSPEDSVRLHVRPAASDRDGADGSVHAEHRSPLPSRFLNRVRKFDSCRGINRFALHPEKRRARRRRNPEKLRDEKRRSFRAHKERHPERVRARNAVWNAIATG